ncbi:hypothetical protein V8C42DRAFT_340860 [Trichoderma barbatum]
MNVLSIRGTDDTGWMQRFNPPPDYNAKKCFMTLGLNVPGASLTISKDEGADVCKSGTASGFCEAVETLGDNWDEGALRKDSDGDGRQVGVPRYQQVRRYDRRDESVYDSMGS